MHKYSWFNIIWLVLLLTSFLPSLNTSVAEAAPNYILDGNSVYINTSDAYIRATPATLTASGWVEVLIKTNNYSGAIDLVYGFNGIDNTQPLKQEFWENYEHTLYNNVEVTKTSTYTPSKIINLSPATKDIAAFSTIDTSLNTKAAIIEAIDPTTKQSKQAIFAYDITDGKSLTYKYKTIEAQPYKQTYEDWNRVNVTPVETIKNYAGASKYKEIKSNKAVVANNIYATRVWIDIPFNPSGISGKYNIGIKPSNLTLNQAISQNKLWLLDPWYNSSWLYRKSYSIAHAAGALTDYQFPLMVCYGAGADGTVAIEGLTAGKVYSDSKCQTDFDDIRVTSSDGTTLQDIWLESKTDSANATFWIEHAAIAAGGSTFYVYYGNATAASVSSGTNTFIFFDDFERGVNNDAVGGAWTASNTVISTDHAFGIGTRSAKIKGDPAFASMAASSTVNDNIAYRARIWKETAQSWLGMYATDGATGDDAIVKTDNTEDIFWYNGAYNDTGGNMTPDTWQLWESNDFVWAGHTYDIWSNGVEIKANADQNLGAEPDDKVKFLSFDNTAGQDAYVDNTIVRNFSTTEPAWGAWTAEETASAYRTSVTTIAASGIGCSSATLTGNITALGSAPENADIRGFVYDTASHGAPGDVAPAASGYASSWQEGTPGVYAYGIGTYTNAPSLASGITYYFRAFAHNSGGYTYGGELNFATVAGGTTTTLYCSSFTSSSAVLNGRVDSIVAGATIATIAFQYGITSTYTANVSASSTPTTGQIYSLNTTGLSAGTTYHYRACFQTNTGCWVYGSDMVFATKGSPTLDEYWNTGYDADSYITNSSNITYQTFTTNTTTVGHSVTSIRLYLKRVGTPGTVKASIKYTSNCTAVQTCWCWPTGDDLTYGTLDGDTFNTSYSWYTFTTPEYCLSANTTYAIVLTVSSGTPSNYIQWGIDSGGGYAGGNYGYSTNGGASWTTGCPADALFEVWGNPCIYVEGAKVFSTYSQTNDWMIAILYKNIYNPYYTNGSDVSSYFYLQLYSVDGLTMLAQTKCPMWGYRPTYIYLNSGQVSSLEWGLAYRIRLYGNFAGYPYMEYVLQSSDWLGTDLTRLDSWVRSTVNLMETYYGISLTTYIAGKGSVLNETGGAIFDSCMPTLSSIRPDVFQIVTTTPGYTHSTFTGGTASAWQTLLGSQLTATFTNLGTTFSISGSTIGAILGFTFYAVVAALCFPAGNAIAAISILFVILLIVWYTGLLPMAALGFICAVAAFFLIWSFWWLKAG